MKSASIRPSCLRNTGAISWTVFTCSKRFSIVGCPFLGLEDPGRGQGPVVGQQRVHPVALAVVGERRFVERPRYIPAPPGELKDTWLGPDLHLGLPAIYNFKQDTEERYDMTFNGAPPGTAGVLKSFSENKELCASDRFEADMISEPLHPPGEPIGRWVR